MNRLAFKLAKAAQISNYNLIRSGKTFYLRENYRTTVRPSYRFNTELDRLCKNIRANAQNATPFRS